jgi:ABC-type glycerol-3-phosphate transport system substrate-binding protein
MGKLSGKGLNHQRLLFVMTSIAFAVSGCGAGGDTGEATAVKPSEPAKPLAPVTLTMYFNTAMTDDDFKLLIADPVKKKYPHITIEPIKSGNNPLERYIASGAPLDLFTIFNGHIPSFQELDIFEDITPLAKKMNFDLGRLDSKTLETMKAISDKVELFGIPYNVQLNALFYNKDIFNKFGVEYPKDGMTWEDATELAKKLTRQQDGVQYRGLDPANVSRMMYPLSTAVVDAKTNKSLVNSELYRKLFETTYNIYAIPGNKPAKWGDAPIEGFANTRSVAMLAQVNIFDKLAETKDLNWDVAQYPSYKDKPNVYGMHDLHVATISKSSKNKEDAMRVIEVLLSDEVQMISTAQTGRVSSLKDPKFIAAYGKDMAPLQGKRISSIFKSKPALAPPFSIHYTKANSIMGKYFQEYADGKKDVNTALREADEEIIQYIKMNTK